MLVFGSDAIFLVHGLMPYLLVQYVGVHLLSVCLGVFLLILCPICLSCDPSVAWFDTLPVCVVCWGSPPICMFEGVCADFMPVCLYCAPSVCPVPHLLWFGLMPYLFARCSMK